MDSGWLLFAEIAVPITAALIIMAIPSVYKQQVRWVATAAAFTMFVLSVIIFAVYNYKEGGLQFDLRLHWLENVAFLGKDGISLHLAVDGISVPMVLLTGIVIFAGCLISWSIEYRNKDFFILLLILVSGVFGVFQSQDLFFFFFFYELAVLPMYLLIGVWGASSNFGTYVRTKEYGAMKLTHVPGGRQRAGVHRHLRHLRGSGQGHLRPARPWPGGLRRDVPEDVLSLLHAGLRGAGRPLALPHLVARRPRGGAHGGEHAARRRPDEAGRLRHPARGDEPLPRGGGVLGARSPGAGHHRRPLRRHLGHGPARPEVRNRLLQREPHGLRAHGPGHPEPHRRKRGRAPDVRPRRDDGPLLRHGGRGVRPGPHARDLDLRRPGPAHAALRGLLRYRRPIVPGTAGAGRLRRRVQHLRRAVQDVSAVRRAGHPGGGHHRRLHPAPAVGRLLRPPEREVGPPEGDAPAGAGRPGPSSSFSSPSWASGRRHSWTASPRACWPCRG